MLLAAVRRLAAPLVLLPLGTACVGPSAAIGPDRIVYSSMRPPNWDVYYFSEPGILPERLTTHPALDYEPVLSPDGRWVVFTSERRGSPDLFVLDLSDRSRPPALLIESEAMEDQVAFAPSGDEIAFVSTVSGNADLFRLPFAPGRVQTMADAEPLTTDTGGDFRPAFSPEGSRLAFSTDRDTTPQPLANFPFARQREGEVYVLDLDTGAERRVTTWSGWDGSPTWSPDGDTLFFYSAGGEPNPPSRDLLGREGGFGIWAMPLQSGVPRRVTPAGIEAFSPELLGDDRVAFVTRSGTGADTVWSVASVTVDGDQPRTLTSGRSHWSPSYNVSTGAMVTHGQGPVDVSDVTPFVGDFGPLLAMGYPIRRSVADRAADLYPVRSAFSVPPHPSEDLVVVQDVAEGTSRLVVVGTDGRDPRELARTQGGRTLMGMKWSKDGAWITYTEGTFFGGANAVSTLWKIRPDGSDRARLTRDVAANDGFADFSADGATVVFRSGRGGQLDLYLMAADGTEVRRLTDEPSRENFPVLSPTDDLIAFVSDRDGTPDATGYRDTDIYTLALNPDGTPGAITRITETPGPDAHVQFSPDGKWLIFTSERGGISDEEPLVQEVLFGPQMYGEIYIYRLADGLTHRLTHDKWEDGAPFWVGPASGTP